ncbi:hypothetical protein [Dokdonella soli]
MSFDRLRRSASDVFGLFALPMLVAALPWPAGLALLKQVSHRSSTFRVEADAAWQVARDHVDGMVDADDWKWRYRLIRWIERADTWLTLTRSTAWWQRHVDIVGEFPAQGHGWLLLTFHWGAGNWVWKLLRARGIAAHFLARRPGASDLGMSRVAIWYGRLRGWAFARIGGLGPLYTGGSVGRIERAWQRRESVVAMLDLPVGEARPACRVDLLGRSAWLPSRLPELAVSRDVPVAILSCGFNIDNGRRTLRLESVSQAADVALVLAHYAAHLDARLRGQSEFWMMWHEAPSMFADGNALRVADTR